MISDHWLWFIVMIVCVLIEAATFGLTTIWFAAGALVVIFLSFTGISLQSQILLFLLISLVLLILTRPLIVKKFKLKQEATNVDSLPGKKAIVTKLISALDKGEIKVSGVFWSAKTSDETELQVGDICIIEKIEGVTAIVTKS